MYASGHQIASHTWTHQDLISLSQTDFNHQIYYNEMAFRNILGFFPTYFRPPYVDCDSNCFARLKTVGYHVIYYDLNTFDYLNDGPNLIQNSKNYFSNYITQSAPNPATGNMLSLSHDTHYQTVYNLTEFMLKTIAADGYGTSVTVGECLGDPPANWYRAAGMPLGCTTGASSSAASSSVTKSSSSAASSSVTKVSSSAASSSVTKSSSSASSSSTSAVIISTDGHCNRSVTCLGLPFGNCCSRYGYCGSTADYCGPFCQPAFGTCSPSPYVLPPRYPFIEYHFIPFSASTFINPVLYLRSSTSTALRISTDGSCGSGITCLNSAYGNCCSKYGYCGNTTAYCGTGCNTSFGTCT